MKNKIKIIYMATLAIIAWFALCLQFYISIAQFLSTGRTLGGAIVHLLSYYTIQNNILVALSVTLLLLAPASAWGKFFSRSSVITAIAVYITIVCLVYQIILRPQHTPVGLFKLADELLHSLDPAMFILFWLIFIPKTKLLWAKAINWLLYPLLYCFYVLIRGAISGYYPYSFIDGNKLSYEQIFINSVFLLFAFLSVGLLFIGISRLTQKNSLLARSLYHTSL
jgi:hypothetical protein